jgi:hypothetical protein
MTSGLPVTSNTRPSNVVRFEQLMYLSLGIGAVQSILQWGRLVNSAHAAGRGIGFIIFVQAFVFAMEVLFIWLIARRRKNWARWVWLMIFVLGIPFAPAVLVRILSSSGPVAAALMCAQNLAQIVALFLIFTGSAREWFKSQFILPNPA